MSLFFTNIAYAESIDEFVSHVDTLIINPLIILLFALALLYFLWGLFEFLSNQDNEEARSVGKSHMIYGIIGLTIMIGVWTILQIITNTLNISSSVKINPQTGTGIVTLPNINP
jgi:hypothetical protein